jgi:hypothetical protein
MTIANALAYYVAVLISSVQKFHKNRPLLVQVCKLAWAYPMKDFFGKLKIAIGWNFL